MLFKPEDNLMEQKEMQLIYINAGFKIVSRFGFCRFSAVWNLEFFYAISRHKFA